MPRSSRRRSSACAPPFARRSARSAATRLGDAIAEELESVRQRVRDHVEGSARRRLGDDGPMRRRGARRQALRDAHRRRARRGPPRGARASPSACAAPSECAEGTRARGRIDRAAPCGRASAPAASPSRRRASPSAATSRSSSSSATSPTRCATASLFMLEFVYAAQELFAGTRSFVFVSELGETTRALRRAAGSPRRSPQVYGGARREPRAQLQLRPRLSALRGSPRRVVDRRTTVVILGDGRTNYHADGAEIVAPPPRARARRLLDLPRAGVGVGHGRQRHAALRGRVDEGPRGADGGASSSAAAREVVARRK